MARSARDSAEQTPAASNVRMMLELERQADMDLPRSELIGERVSHLFGSFGFIVAQASLVAVWVLWNVLATPGWRVDPFPFGLLTVCVSLESVFITICVLIAQNRMSRRTERRHQLHFQIALLAEQELTVALRLLRDIAVRHGATPDADDLEVVEQLSEDTDVHELAQKLEQENEG